MVAVLNKDGKALMPTNRHRKVRLLLKEGKAKVVKKWPYTVIQLLYDTPDIIQPVTLSNDTGSKHSAFSVSSEKKEFITLQVDGRSSDIKDKLKTRKENRRNRRNKLRSRPKRFDNRKRKENWLAPSVQSIVDLHIRWIDRLSNDFPVTQMVFETGKFDMAKIINPDIQGVEYQQGERFGFENTKSYIRWRDNYQCRQCGCKKGVMEVHHIIHKENGGTDRVNNLVLLCHSCHQKVHHKKNFKLKDKILIQVERTQGLRYASVMNVIRTYVIRQCQEKYGNL